MSDIRRQAVGPFSSHATAGPGGWPLVIKPGPRKGPAEPSGASHRIPWKLRQNTRSSHATHNQSRMGTVWELCRSPGVISVAGAASATGRGSGRRRRCCCVCGWPGRGAGGAATGRQAAVVGARGGQCRDVLTLGSMARAVRDAAIKLTGRIRRRLPRWRLAFLVYRAVRAADGPPGSAVVDEVLKFEFCGLCLTRRGKFIDPPDVDLPVFTHDSGEVTRSQILRVHYIRLRAG